MALIATRPKMEQLGFRFLGTYGYSLDRYALGLLRVVVSRETGKVVSKYVVKKGKEGDQ